MQQQAATENKQVSEIEVFIEAEADEQWSFVQKKEHPFWLWYMIEKQSRKVIAFTFGRRRDDTYQTLLNLLPQSLIQTLYTDNWGAYERVRFAPLHLIGKENTQRIERNNLTLRTRIKRLARKTICFSKSELMHKIVVGLFICTNMF